MNNVNNLLEHVYSGNFPPEHNFYNKVVTVM